MYGVSDRNYYHRLGINLKIELKNLGYKVRLVESRDDSLSSVIVTQEKLIEQGADILVMKINNQTLIGRTLAVQKFKDYSFRDYSRPARDTSRGLMPPKLAKMMLNLSGAELEDSVLDPFCGSGTILAEGLLMGFKNLVGTDIDKKAIEKTEGNISWLTDNVRNAHVRSLQLFACDALKIHEEIEKIDYIVTEADLGPFNFNEKKKKEFEYFYSRVLQEFKKLNPKKIVIAVPAWRVGDKIIKLDLKTDYKIINRLIYGRENANVLREIYILEN